MILSRTRVFNKQFARNVFRGCRFRWENDAKMQMCMQKHRVRLRENPLYLKFCSAYCISVCDMV